MSENIRGITFAEQAVTPADDAIVRRAILGDGILTGCDVTYSGSTLTMAAGYIIACGRAFQVTAAQNWAVVDATSGYARLLLTLDLTKTATEDTFKQIEFSLEYAAAEDGFLDLVQEDINLSGAKYQIVAAVVSLGTGGITGIVSKLERTEGGGGLNFKVVAGLTQPGSATENTIWVKTEKMTGWIIDANQPENLEEGMVWIQTGTESVVEFNALKKNAIKICPISAKQYKSGKIGDIDALIYQAGEWRDWALEQHLFTAIFGGDNDYHSSITGGWTNQGIVNENGSITLDASSGVKWFGTKGKISRKGYKKLSVYMISGVATIAATRKSLDATNSSVIAVMEDVSVSEPGYVELNIDGIDESFYVGVYAYGGNSVTFSDILLNV